MTQASTMTYFGEYNEDGELQSVGSTQAVAIVFNNTVRPITEATYQAFIDTHDQQRLAQE